jgi:signal peptidase I
MPSLRMRDEKPSVLDTPEAAPAPVAPKPSEASVATKRPSLFQRHGTTLLLVALLSIPAYFLASRFIVTAVVIQGRSMMPALKDGEHYYLNRWQYLLVSPKRGDIVVIKDPGHTDFAVKRIVAQPFDWINIKNGMLYINGRRLDEPYLAKDTRTETPDLKEKWIQLGKDQFYMLGDNRENSEDSRFYGRVLAENIIGKLIK